MCVCVCVCVCICVCVCVSVSVCLCVSVRERQRQRQTDRQTDRQTNRDRERPRISFRHNQSARRRLCTDEHSHAGDYLQMNTVTLCTHRDSQPPHSGTGLCSWISRKTAVAQCLPRRNSNTVYTLAASSSKKMWTQRDAGNWN